MAANPDAAHTNTQRLASQAIGETNAESQANSTTASAAGQRGSRRRAHRPKVKTVSASQTSECACQSRTLPGATT